MGVSCHQQDRIRPRGQRRLRDLAHDQLALKIINETADNPLFFLRYSPLKPVILSHTSHSHSIVPGGLLVTS